MRKTGIVLVAVGLAVGLIVGLLGFASIVAPAFLD